MITRSQLTPATPNTLILGIANRGKQTAVTATLRLRNGAMEADVMAMVGGDLWQTFNDALADLRIVRAPYLLLLTTCDELHQWLQKPIKVEPTETKRVRVGKELFTVKTGGNENQWSILRHLFMYTWRCDRVPALSKAEGMLHD